MSARKVEREGQWSVSICQTGSGFPTMQNIYLLNRYTVFQGIENMSNYFDGTLYTQKQKKTHWIVFFSRFGGFSFGEKTKLAKLNNQNVQELLQKFSLLKTDDKSFGIDNDKIWSNVALLLHTMATEDIVKVMANSAPYAQNFTTLITCLFISTSTYFYFYHKKHNYTTVILEFLID